MTIGLASAVALVAVGSMLIITLLLPSSQNCGLRYGMGLRCAVLATGSTTGKQGKRKQKGSLETKQGKHNCLCARGAFQQGKHFFPALEPIQQGKQLSKWVIR